MKSINIKGTYICDREAKDRASDVRNPMHKHPIPGSIDYAGSLRESDGGGLVFDLTIGDYILITWTVGHKAIFNRYGSYSERQPTAPSYDNITADVLTPAFFRQVLLSCKLTPLGVDDHSEKPVVPLTKLPPADPTLSEWQQDAADRGLPVPGRKVTRTKKSK